MSDTAGSRNDGFVDQLLLEADMDDDGQLRPALLQLRALAAEAPAPSADIAALMAGAGRASAAAPATATLTAVDLRAVEPAAAGLTPAAPVAEAAGPAASMRHAERPADELAARRRAKRRITLTTLSVAASLAAGGAVAVASDQGVRDSFAQLNQAVTSFVTGTAAAPAGGAGSAGGTVPAPRPASTTATTGPESLPSVPASAPAPAVAAPSAAPEMPPTTAAHGQSGGKNPVQQTSPGSVTEDVRKGLDQASKLPVPASTEVPLPGRIPDVPLR
ncbi:MAG: hypothetical protein HOQ04_05140 [Pseudarthrobacter sp.]|nr:hypothetical protein [Pseudarthrobacter sp.]